MTNNFEEKKMLLYIANGLSNKKFVKINIEKIKELALSEDIEILSDSSDKERVFAACYFARTCRYGNGLFYL